jgi:membrane fusion protein, multidrug efflux system
MKRRWLMLVLVSSLAGAAAPGCQQAQSGAFKLPDPVAVYDTPITKTVTDYEEFPGYTDSPRSVNVRARVSGYLNNFYFTDGQMVREGDKLFEIDPRPYKADRDRAKATVEQLEAHERRVERSYIRAKNLLASHKVSPEEYDMYEADYKETVANLEVARANLELSELNLKWTEIHAPTSGQVSRRMVDPGNLVKADDTILTSIVSLDPLYVYFDVDEQAMLRVKRLMQEGKIKLSAQGEKHVPVRIGLSDERDFPHEGDGNFMDNRVDSATGTLHFRATINNPEDAFGNRFIIPGLFVRVRLQIGEPRSALMIREQALVTDQGNKKVWVVRPKMNKQGQPETDENGQPKYVAQMRAVALGVLRGGLREIQSGIEPGDWVVVMGMQRLRPDVTVRVEEFTERSDSGAVASSDKPKPPQASAGSDAAGKKIGAAPPADSDVVKSALKASAKEAPGAGAKDSSRLTRSPASPVFSAPARSGSGRGRPAN